MIFLALDMQHANYIIFYKYVKYIFKLYDLSEIFYKPNAYNMPFIWANSQPYDF